jgi:LmbE family N-acetylglucosaminyl deacetylase
MAEDTLDLIPLDSPRLDAIRRALIVVAHPDDVESHCGGTVARLVDVGCRVTLVLCTSGDKGSADPAADPIEVAAQREREQLTGAEILGIGEVVFLRWPDGELENGKLLRGQIVAQIRRARPDLVITHDPEHPWPPYTAHRDHRAAGRATLDALYPDARDPLSFPEHLTAGLPTHITPEAWLIMSQRPDLAVDISQVFPRKLAARLAHASQFRDAAALETSFRARAAELGAPYGLPLAEVLKQVRFR